MDNKSVKNNIYKARIEKGLSQADVAEKLKISQTSYHKIEKGSTSLISERVTHIAEILGVSDEKLVLGYDVPSEAESQKKLEEAVSAYNIIIKEKEKRISELEEIIEDKKSIIAFLEEKKVSEN